MVHYGKGLISVFQEFFASIKKVVILVERQGTGLLFYKVLRISQFLTILSLKSFGNS